MKIIVKSFAMLLGTALTWQAMYEFYKFDKADYITGWILLIEGLLMFCISNLIPSTHLKK